MRTELRFLADTLGLGAILIVALMVTFLSAFVLAFAFSLKPGLPAALGFFLGFIGASAVCAVITIRFLAPKLLAAAAAAAPMMMDIGSMAERPSARSCRL